MVLSEPYLTNLGQVIDEFHADICTYITFVGYFAMECLSSQLVLA